MTDRFVFELTEAEVLMVIELADFLTALGEPKRKSSHLARLATLANKLDEGRMSQIRPWERCPTCDGSGWVEGA